jgi:hypothetical protein
MFNTDALTPAMLGRLSKHLARPVRYRGEVTTYGAIYAGTDWTGKRLGKHFHGDWDTPPTVTYMLDNPDDTALEVPKLVWECIGLPVVVNA